MKFCHIYTKYLYFLANFVRTKLCVIDYQKILKYIVLMVELDQKKCVPCSGGVKSFEISEIHKYLKKIDGWDVKSNENKSYFLEKSFKFKNFIESQQFIDEVSKIAETEGHHPDIMFGWGYATIKIFTHKINGLVESDFILAAKIDKI